HWRSNRGQGSTDPPGLGSADQFQPPEPDHGDDAAWWQPVQPEIDERISELLHAAEGDPMDRPLFVCDECSSLPVLLATALQRHATIPRCRSLQPLFIHEQKTSHIFSGLLSHCALPMMSF